MFTVLKIILLLLLIIYGIIAISLFILFISEDYRVTIKHIDEGKKKEVYGIKRICICLLMSLIWPICISEY